MKWVEVVVKTIPENEDIVSDILYQAGAVGLAIEDPQDFVDLTNDKASWDFIDENLMNFDHDGISLKAYFAESEDISKIIEFINNRVVKAPLIERGDSYGEVVLNSVDDEEFSESWKNIISL